jgi:alkylhydroperoxidase/carboxymuconolactone decarboxylase family protein YurZ
MSEEHQGNPLASYEAIDGEALALVRQLGDCAFCEGALPKKIKLLMAMILDASHGAVGGVRSLAMQAQAEGATKQEIAEALRVALAVNGSSCIYVAAAALRDLDLGE